MLFLPLFSNYETILGKRLIKDYSLIPDQPQIALFITGPNLQNAKWSVNRFFQEGASICDELFFLFSSSRY
jgi:hypothetical protein